MEFFLDTAKIEEIEQGLEWGMVDGVTTNPSLLAKEGKQYLPAVKEIAALVPGPVSGEVLATDYQGMMDEGDRERTHVTDADLGYRSEVEELGPVAGTVQHAKAVDLDIQRRNDLMPRKVIERFPDGRPLQRATRQDQTARDKRRARQHTL